MIAAMAAFAAVAFAAVAIAQSTDRTHTMDVLVTPTDAGTKKKPKNGKIDILLETDPNENVTVDKFTYLFPKDIKISTKGFKHCTVEQIEDNDLVPPKKCKRSKVGSGFASAYLTSRQGTRVPLDVTLYANKNSLTIYLQGQGNFSGVKSAFVAEILKGTDGYAQNLTTDVPKSVEFQAGAPVVLESVDLTLGPKKIKRKFTVKKKGKKRKKVKKFQIVSVRGCADNLQHTLGTKLEYTDQNPNDATPAPAPTFAQDTTPCTK